MLLRKKCLFAIRRETTLQVQQEWIRYEWLCSLQMYGNC